MSLLNPKSVSFLAALLGTALAASAAAPAAPAAKPAAPAAAPATPAAAPAPASAAKTAGPGDPVAIIRKKDGELQKLLREKPAKTERIKVLINGIFDFEELGKKALGPDLWKGMSPDQQKRFVKAFREMVENSSVKKLEAYQSDSASYDPPELREGKANVTSHVFSKGQESIVVYKLIVKDGEWKAWDLVIDDLSTAGNYGDQFKKILQTSDMDGLIARLEKKAAGTDAKPADNVKAKSEKAAAKPATAAPAAGPKAAPAKPATPAPAAKEAASGAAPAKPASPAAPAKPAAPAPKP